MPILYTNISENYNNPINSYEMRTNKVSLANLVPVISVLLMFFITSSCKKEKCYSCYNSFLNDHIDCCGDAPVPNYKDCGEFWEYQDYVCTEK